MREDQLGLGRGPQKRPQGNVDAQACLDFTPAARELAQEMHRRETNTTRILARLERGPATTMELGAIGGLRFGARIRELRQAGYAITTEGRVNHAVYRLVT